MKLNIFITLVLIGYINSQYTPKTFYYFSSKDVVFSTNPVLNIVDIQSGVKSKALPMTSYPGGTILAAFNNGDSLEELLLFGYKRLDKETWELTLTNFNVNNFTEIVVGSIQVPSPLTALWDQNPSFGYDPELKAIFGLNVVELQMNITKYDFANSHYEVLYIPPYYQEPMNFLPCGTYNAENKTYYISFFNDDSRLEILEYNVETGEVQFGHTYANYPNYAFSDIIYANSNFYGLYNPHNVQSILVGINTSNETLTKLFTVNDNDGLGNAQFATNQEYLVFVTHQNKTNTLITSLNLDTMESTKVSISATTFPNYPLNVPVNAII